LDNLGEEWLFPTIDAATDYINKHKAMVGIWYSCNKAIIIILLGSCHLVEQNLMQAEDDY